MLYRNILETRSGQDVIDPRDTATYSKEMSLTPDQFIASMKAMMKDQPGSVEWDRSKCVITSGSGQVTAHFTPRPDRVIGSLSLPVLKVVFRFQGYTGNAIQRFSDRFDMHFLRMGGG